MDSINPQPPPGDFFGSLGVKAYRFRAIARRNWWILALTVALGLAYEGWVLLNKPIQFKAIAQLSVREAPVTDSIRVQTLRDDFMGTMLNNLKDPVILERARARLALEMPQMTAPMPLIVPGVIPRTSIFEVIGFGPDREYTRLFVNALASEYIAYRGEARDRTLGIASGGFSDRLKVFRSEEAAQQADLQAFIAKNNMPFWNEQAKSSADFLSELKTSQSKLQTELQRLENLTPDQLLTSAPTITRIPQQQPSGDNAGNPSPGTTQIESGANNELYALYIQSTQSLVQAQARLDERSKVWKPRHPGLQRLQADVEQFQRQIETIKTQNRSATEARKVAIVGELKSLEVSIEQQNAKVLEASAKGAEYQALEQKVLSTRELIKTLAGTVITLDKDKVNPDLVELHREAPFAMEVDKGTVKHLLLGLFGGLVVGLIVLVIMDRADDRLASSSEILERFTESILGQIPDVADTRKESGLPLLQLEDDRYTYAEAYRSLRSSLIFLPGQSDLRTVLITSAIPNEGKSTIASNLAVTMSASGARVLLVDADLRRGDLASLFDVDGRTGLSDILRGNVPWQEAALETRYETLTLIPRGPVTNQSGELLLRPIFEKLLDEMKEAYDLVIFNTAPILATDDTPTIAPHFDGTLMVLRAQFTSAKLTRNALNALYQRQVNVLGLILNCVDTEMPDYYYYRYPKYYAA